MGKTVARSRSLNLSQGSSLESARGVASAGSHRCTLPAVPKTPEADQLEFSASYSFEREDALYDLKRDLKKSEKNALIASPSTCIWY